MDTPENSFPASHSQLPPQVLHELKLLVAWDRRFRAVESFFAATYSKLITIEKEIVRLQDHWRQTDDR
jgi:hypothetical protein